MLAYCMANPEEYPSVLHQAHAAVHTLRADAPMSMLASSPHSWTCMLDTDSAMRPRGFTQVRVRWRYDAPWVMHRRCYHLLC